MALALLVPGGNGQLGRELALRASDTISVVAPGSAELDITNAGAVVEAVKTLAESARATGARPVLVNAAAYNAVDAAEADSAPAFAVNGEGPRLLAAACAAHGVPLIHISTDYVFAGDNPDRPYEADDVPRPLSAYGASKRAGEDAVLGSGARAWVVRTSWVYGAYGKNFVKTMARLANEHPTVSVVDDQHGSPTWTGDLADGLVELAHRVSGDNPPAERILHCTGGGETTWYRFAAAVFTELGQDADRVLPCKSEEMRRPAPRPMYSVLSDKAWRDSGLTPMPPWREALAAAFAKDGDHFRTP